MLIGIFRTITAVSHADAIRILEQMVEISKVPIFVRRCGATESGFFAVIFFSPFRTVVYKIIYVQAGSSQEVTFKQKKPRSVFFSKINFKVTFPLSSLREY